MTILRRQLIRVGRALVRTIGKPSGNYGHDRILRRYAGFPRPLPMNVRIQHGWYHDIEDRLSDLHVDQPLQFVWSRRMAERWPDFSDRPVMISGTPLVHFRHMEAIQQHPDASGTVVFPQHSTRSYDSVYDVDRYCRDLDDLPVEYKPITICLHFRDFDRLAPAFERNGYPDIVTAGESRAPDLGFARNFYEILARHKYASSNDILTGMFYAIEMGIPFFIYGPDAEDFSTADGSRGNFKPFADEIRPLFTGPTTTISEEQRRLVRQELGVDDAAPPREMRRRLWKLFLFHEIPRYPGRLVRELRGIGENREEEE